MPDTNTIVESEATSSLGVLCMACGSVVRLSIVEAHAARHGHAPCKLCQDCKDTILTMKKLIKEKSYNS